MFHEGFRYHDLVVFNGIITYWGIIESIVSPLDLVTFASYEDIELYNSKK